MTSQARLGFIGLGHLGSRIAHRLAAAGFPITVYNRDLEKTKELAALGAGVAPDPRTLADRVDVVLSCLADRAAVESVYLGSGGVLGAVNPGTVIIEMSTVAPETSQKLFQAG
jgi:3-hydroxyisobutyrate dehydrogenase-like beta-hydroxyacid dehydrogenase